MPAISMFYGIVIYLYFFDDERHKTPHIHAKYQGEKASFSILDGELLSGRFPTPKARMVQAQIEIHREELLANWELAVSGAHPFQIEPLRQEAQMNMESIIEVRARDDFHLELLFSTGENGVFDAQPYLQKGVFQRLKDINEFKRAYVAYDTVCWPGGLDIAPETLYDRAEKGN